MTDNATVGDMLRDMQTEQREMRLVIHKIMWHLRGSLSRQEAWTLSIDERKDMVTLIEEHKEMTEKTGLPLM